MRWKKVSFFLYPFNYDQNRLSQMNNPSIKTNVAEDTILGHVSICTTIVPRLHGFHYRPSSRWHSEYLFGQTTLAATS